MRELFPTVLVCTLLVVGFASFARWKSGASSQFGAGRRRVYWERKGGLLPPEGITQMMRRRVE